MMNGPRWASTSITEPERCVGGRSWMRASVKKSLQRCGQGGSLSRWVTITSGTKTSSAESFGAGRRTSWSVVSSSFAILRKALVPIRCCQRLRIWSRWVMTSGSILALFNSFQPTEARAVPPFWTFSMILRLPPRCRRPATSTAVGSSMPQIGADCHSCLRSCCAAVRTGSGVLSGVLEGTGPLHCQGW